MKKSKIRLISILGGIIPVVGLITTSCAQIKDNKRVLNQQQFNNYNYHAREVNDQNANNTYLKLKDIIQKHPGALTIFSEIDHRQNAIEAGLKGNAIPKFNKVIIFGNGGTGTNLMVKSPGLGLELPLRIQVFEDAGKTWVSTNATVGTLTNHGQNDEALANRFVDVVQKIIDQIAKPLNNPENSTPVANDKYERKPAEVTIQENGTAENTASQTFEKFKKQILTNAKIEPKDEKMPNFGRNLKEGAGIFSVIDHRQNAIDGNFKDQSTKFNTFNKVLIFGNAKVGTNLINAQPNIGLELPLRLHVYVQNNKVFVNTNAIESVLTKYGPQTEQRKSLANTLINAVKKNFFDKI